MANKYVHEDILNSILARLPTKPLLRCRCVSKHWNRLISDPKFMKMRSRRMILFPVHPFYAIDNLLLDDDTSKSVIKVCSPLEYPEGTQFFVGGTLNGIVLLIHDCPKNIMLYNPKNIMLYNPFTRAFKKVREPSSDDYSDVIYGLGYGTAPDDTKIVRFESSPHDWRSCYVFSLKNWSWSTPMKLVGDYLFLKYHGIFVNGFLYWIAIGDDGWVIVSLDVKSMVFSEIQLPPDCSYVWAPLGTLNGRLCMICYQGDMRTHELWVRNEDSDLGKSWTKVRSLTSVWRFKQDGFHSLCILDEGKLVMWKNPNQIIIYNLLKDSHTTIHGENIPISLAQEWSTQAIQYVESLTSPSDMCFGSGFV